MTILLLAVDWNLDGLGVLARARRYSGSTQEGYVLGIMSFRVLLRIS
jgi:hypothetical protein